MALIDNEEAARRLARVIISDIELYEKKKLQAGDDLTTQMAEGRALFRRRVVPELTAIFESVVEAKRSGALTGGPSALTPPPLGTSPMPPAAAPPAATVVPSTPVAAAAAPLDEDRPVETVHSDSTARTDLTAEAAATRNPDLPAARISPRAPGQDDAITPVSMVDVVAGRAGSPDMPQTGWTAERRDASPHEEAPEEAPDEQTLQDDRVTSPSAFLAVPAATEEPPTAARPPARPPAPPAAHTPVPPRAPPAAPPPFVALAAPTTPQPMVIRREVPPIEPGPAEKTPVPLSVSLAAAPSALRAPASPSPVAAPFAALATLPAEAVPAPAEPSAGAEDVVNLRAKTSKVRVLLYVVATAGGLALIGRFLTRFL